MLNIFLCIAAPLVVVFFISSERSFKRAPLFLLFGMAACFAAGFLNSAVSLVCGYSDFETALYIAPFVEECLKVLPVLVFFFLLRPDFRALVSAGVATGAGFGVLESVYYLYDGLAEPWLILLRGFGTGTMHAVTVTVFTLFLWYVTHKDIVHSWVVFILCGAGILASAVTLHGFFNMFTNSSDSVVQFAGYLIPLVVVFIYGVVRFVRGRHEGRSS